MSNDIAVVGVSCRTAGAENKDEFWQLLVDGQSAIQKKETLDKKIYGEALATSFKYGEETFGLTHEQVEGADPQLIALLALTKEALIDGEQLERAQTVKTGVFISSGSSFHWRNELNKKNQEIDLYYSEEHYFSTQISYRFNLKGPSTGFFSACASSSIAVHMACQSILAGDCDLALAGGAYFVNQQPEMYLKHSIFSATGQCRTFDCSANGTVYGTGGGMVLLKYYEDALIDGDRIYAVIKGSSINNDGADKMSYTSPSIEGIGRVTSEAVSLSNCSPEDFQFIAVHGTGTPFGDLIELEGIKQPFVNVKKKLYIGSVNPNIGYLDVASGVVNMIKTILSIYYKKIPPNINIQEIDRGICPKASPFTIHTETVEYESEHIITAGIHSYGEGGSNVFLILQTPIEKE